MTTAFKTLSIAIGLAGCGVATRAGAQPATSVPAPRPAVRAAAERAATSGIRIDQQVSQTAVLPGDRFQYRLTVTAPADMKISVEDLAGRAASFAPYVLVNTVTSSSDQAGTRAYVFDYTLASYEIGDAVVPIPGAMFRYQPAAAAPTDHRVSEYRTPPVPVATRSTLNRPIGESSVRAFLPRSFRAEHHFGLWASLGGAGVALTALPVFAWVWRTTRRLAAKPRTNLRRARRAAARALGPVVGAATSDGDEVKQAYASLERVVHEYLRNAGASSAADALTETDVDRAVHGLPADVSDLARTVITNGQRCRYSPSDATAWRTRFEADLQSACTVFGVRA